MDDGPDQKHNESRNMHVFHVLYYDGNYYYYVKQKTPFLELLNEKNNEKFQLNLLVTDFFVERFVLGFLKQREEHFSSKFVLNTRVFYCFRKYALKALL